MPLRLPPLLCGLIVCSYLFPLSAHQRSDQVQERAGSLSQVASLNHIVVYLDAATAEAIATSAVLKEFADFRVATIQASDATWTGRYISGRQTYVEIFSPDENQRSPAGTVRIAVSGDRPGVIATLQGRLESAGIKAIPEKRRRRFGDRDVDWYRRLGVWGTIRRPFIVWAMEYEASFFDQPEAAKEAAEGPDDTISRERYLSDEYKNHSMRDITALDMAVTEQDYQVSEPLLHASGFRLSRTGEGMNADGTDVDFLFRFVTPDQIGLRRIVFILTRPVAGSREEAIGDSALRIGPGDRAEWVFRSRSRSALKD
jgi:Family of unknown function (DUF5829)